MILLKNAWVEIKLKKSFFFQELIHFLGHVIAAGNLQVVCMTTKAVEPLQYLSTVLKTQPFLGLCNVYRSFVPNFARLAAPLNKNLEKGEPLQFELDDRMGKAVDVFKEKLINTPALALPRKNRQYTLVTDHFCTQLGCVLLQYQEDM